MKQLRDISGEIRGVAQLLAAMATFDDEIADSLMILADKLDNLSDEVFDYGQNEKGLG